MSSIIDEQLDSTGIAQVLVILKSPPPPSAIAASGLAAGGLSLAALAKKTPPLAGIDNFFTQSEFSQTHALAMAGMTNVAAMASAAVAPAARAGRVRTPPAVLH